MWLSLAAAFAGPAAARPVAVVLTGGAESGAGPFLDDLAVLWQRNVETAPQALVVEPMEGARARLRALARGRGDFAVVEASLAAEALREYKGVVAVGLLWANYLHILTRLPRISALALPLTHPVVVAESARYAFEGLVELNREKPAQRQLVRMAGRGVSPLQAAGEGEAVVLFSAPAPSREVARALAATPGLRLLPPSTGLAEELHLLYPWLQTARLPADAYGGVGRQWELPARHLLMVTRRDLAAPVAKKMVETLYQKGGAVAPFNPLFGTLNSRANAALAELIPFHPAVVRALGLPRRG